MGLAVLGLTIEDQPFGVPTDGVDTVTVESEGETAVE
jgi:hypothetical protein